MNKFVKVIVGALSINALTIVANATAAEVQLDSQKNYLIEKMNKVIALIPKPKGKCHLLVMVYAMDGSNTEILRYAAESNVHMAEGSVMTTTAAGSVVGSPFVQIACHDGRMTVTSPFPEIDL